jgi:hypothetical protein
MERGGDKESGFGPENGRFRLAHAQAKKRLGGRVMDQPGLR